MTVSENIDQAGNKLKEATAKVSDKSAEAAKIVADKASVAAETLSRHAGRAADEIGAQVAAEARDTINEVAGSRKHRAGRYLSSVGAAIDASSDKLSEDGLTETANYAQSAARNVSQARWRNRGRRYREQRPCVSKISCVRGRCCRLGPPFFWALPPIRCSSPDRTTLVTVETELSDGGQVKIRGPKYDQTKFNHRLTPGIDRRTSGS